MAVAHTHVSHAQDYQPLAPLVTRQEHFHQGLVSVLAQLTTQISTAQAALVLAKLAPMGQLA